MQDGETAGHDEVSALRHSGRAGMGRCTFHVDREDTQAIRIGVHKRQDRYLERLLQAPQKEPAGHV